MIPKAQLHQINLNRVKIADNIYIDERLLYTLQSKDVLSSEMLQTIKSIPGEREKSTRLLDHILKQSKATLDKFLDTLKDCKQKHVANLFVLQEQNNQGWY